ncbi:hypothetical protein [Pelagivirga sediminicola]|uniref:hypothetical protein n=1 Tax=Pelagivirga sediminicola TaxID=2170575 RepID=UPI001402C434|nr:hypothetical protein [Pelagivirga sediminicola]
MGRDRRLRFFSVRCHISEINVDIVQKWNQTVADVGFCEPRSEGERAFSGRG